MYIAVMASWPKPEIRTPPEHVGPTLVPRIEVAIQSVGPSLPRVEAPEGWVKKVERAREGKVWVGYFHVWETELDGQRVRRKKEKTLGPVTKPKHEALNELAEHIAEQTGKLAKQGESISNGTDLGNRLPVVGVEAPLIRQLVKAKDVANKLGVSISWVIQHASGKRGPYLPAVKMGPGRSPLRFDPTDVEKVYRRLPEYGRPARQQSLSP